MAFLVKYWRPLAVVITLLIIWLHGHHTGAEKENSKWEYRYAILQKAAAEERAEHEKRNRETERKWQDAADLISNNGLEALREMQRENDALRDDIAAGRKRLQIAATCPQMPGATEAPDAPGVDSGGGAELTADARQAYHSLRSGITRQQAKLRTCQDLLRAEGE